jgi:protein disulfide-isomerase
MNQMTRSSASLMSVLVGLSLLNNCAGTSTQTKEILQSEKQAAKTPLTSSPTKDLTHGTRTAWFDGSFDDALKVASENNQLLFVYWGAVWCPPCNAVKSRVFSTQEFAKSLTGVIPVWLDGDDERAQEVGERLKLSGYPSLVVYNSQGQELVRFSESLSQAEFSSTMDLLKGNSTNLMSLMDKAIAKKATSAEWDILGSLSWYESKDVDLSSIEVKQKRLALATACPSKTNIKACSSLWSQVFVAAAEIKEEDLKDKKHGKQNHIFLSSAKQKFDSELKRILSNEESILASRPMFLNSLDEVMAWCFAQPSTKKTPNPKASTSDANLKPKPSTAEQKLALKWQEATSLINSKTDSLDEKMLSRLAWVKADKIANVRSAFDDDSIKKIIAEVALADSMATSVFQRQTAIPTGAYALQEVGKPDLAKALLEKELKTSQTPWYIYSSLAQIEEKAKNLDQARAYSSKAAATVQGRASKIQWTSSELLMHVRTGASPERIAELTENYFAQSFAFEDAFSGRNMRRMSSVRKQLKDVAAKNSSVKAKIDLAKTRCGSMSTDQAGKCNEYFSQF